MRIYVSNDTFMRISKYSYAVKRVSAYNDTVMRIYAYSDTHMGIFNAICRSSSYLEMGQLNATPI
jgi:hypothetical protein